MKKFWYNFAKFWRILKKLQRRPLGDFEKIVKKFHNNFGDFFLVRVRQKTKSLNIRSKFLRILPRICRYFKLVLPIFFSNFFQNLQKFFPIFVKFILYTFRKFFYLTWRYKSYLFEEAKFLEPVPSTPVMLGPQFQI